MIGKRLARQRSYRNAVFPIDAERYAVTRDLLLDASGFLGIVFED
jgi:hypothetical protein